jgi:hypothetical protein
MNTCKKAVGGLLLALIVPFLMAAGIAIDNASGVITFPSSSGSTTNGALWVDGSGNLQLRKGGSTFQINEQGGGGGAAFDAYRNLRIMSATTTSVTLTLDGGFLDDGSTAARVTAVSRLISISSTGADALDTGSVAANTWYQIGLAADSDGSNVCGLFKAGTGSPTLPGGRTLYHRYGWIRTNGSSQFDTFFQQDHQTRPYDSTASGLNNGAATSNTNVDLSAFAPPTARLLYLNGWWGTQGGGSNNPIAILVDGNASSGGEVTYLDNRGDASSAGWIFTFSYVPVPCTAAQVIRYRVDAGTTRLTIQGVGWWDAN